MYSHCNYAKMPTVLLTYFPPIINQQKVCLNCQVLMASQRLKITKNCLNFFLFVSLFVWNFFGILLLRKCCKIRPFSNFQTLWTLASHSSSLKGHFSRGPASPCDLQNNEFPSQNSRQHLWESIMYRVILRRFEFCHKNRIRGAKTFLHIIVLRLVSQIF